MEKYFVIRNGYGIQSIQKEFDDETKAAMFMELLADGNENENIKFYLAKVIASK